MTSTAVKEATTAAREAETADSGAKVVGDSVTIGNFGRYRTQIDAKVTVVEKVKLPEALAKTFTDGQYRTVVTNEEITVYRVFGYNARSNGTFATTNPASSAIQAKIDSAILPEWKNSLQYEAEIIVPKGTILNIGRVEEQFTLSGTRLVGNADQILLPLGWDDLNWIKSIREISVGGK